ncbi:MAG: hypothetical protein SA378_08900 [Sedimentibacter sp.]|uniref:hypothetical protein n=1 Tax=Sedimentibacter sp. TaxID=1960295 RepID=UPI0029823C74|nr:hypothetical protein [Sedimentibacter sp.]MDW5300240.1 hypothetical protein [Sedimentibacter sp.]
MYREFNEKISYMKECIQKKYKLKGLLKQTEQDMIREKLLLNKILNDIEKENQYILKLESANITSLFYLILGNEEGRLVKEKQELLKVRLKYDQCRHNVEFLAEESKEIVNKLSSIEVCDSDYEDLIDKKLEGIHIEDKETSEELKKFIKRKESMKFNIKEIDEAIICGEEALIAIEETIKQLESIEDWGIVCIGDNGIDSIKHNHVDEARKYAEEAHRMLLRLNREISDIIMMTGAEIAVSTFETFADSFFDGLIFDWVVQSEISKSLDAVKNTKNQTDKAMSKLYEEKVTEEFMINQIEDQINRIIENA